VVSVPHTLSQLASVARLRGQIAEAARLTRAEALVRAQDVDSLADLSRLIAHPPPEVDGETIFSLRQLDQTDGALLVHSAVADLPADLRELYEAGVLTLEQLAVLHHELRVTAAADIAAAVADQAIRRIPALGETIEHALAGALDTLRRDTTRIPLGRAVALTDPILARLCSIDAVDWALPAGSLRRAQETVGDIELVAASADPEGTIAAVTKWPDVERVLLRNSDRVYLVIDRVQIGMRFQAPATAGAVLLHLTGSAAHSAALRARASDRGYRLTATAFYGPDREMRPAATEEAIYTALKLPVIPPEIRNGHEEIDAADEGSLPALLTLDDIRGDLHMHSTWSDGHDSVEAMIRACRDLGYEYIAITDHSPHSGASRSLTDETVARQAEEIARLRQQFGNITILHGCEADILPDGRLDFPDRTLEQFDIVLASLHQRAEHDPGQLLDRYLAATRHPLVTLITHPTNRMVPHRPGYDLDYDRLFEAAVETGTLLEIDGAPGHLDMDGTLARRAVAAGVTVAVNSDCHRAGQLGRQMRLGVMTARRGWVQARHVLNTRPLADVRAAIAHKRS
jgi:DNA polymerase (family 10)